MDGQHPGALISRLAVLFVAAIVACSHSVSGQRSCSYANAEFERANADFIEGWEIIFPEEDVAPVEYAVRRVDVTCVDYIDGASIGWPGYMIAGYTESPGHVVVATINPLDGAPVALRSSSYFHELVHVALWTVDGDADVDHAEGTGPWSPQHDALIAILKD